MSVQEAVDEVAEALEAMAQRKASIDAEDARIVKTIHHVEHALNQLRPSGPTTLSYAFGRRGLKFMAANRRWIIVWRGDREDEDVPLLSASRDVRAETFSPILGGLAPIERLVIEVADNVEAEGDVRSPMTHVAERLSAALIAAGYRPPNR